MKNQKNKKAIFTLPQKEILFSDSEGLSEKAFLKEKERHKELLFSMFDKIENKDKIKKIFDAGSGGTSISLLLGYFKNAHIEAVVFPGDERKKLSVKMRIKSNRYVLNELDLVKNKITKSYNLVLAHLVLGEALKWGNTVDNLLKKILEIDTKYFLFFDIKEDPNLNFQHLAEKLSRDGLKIVAQDEIEIKTPQKLLGAGSFVAKTYIAFLVKRVPKLKFNGKEKKR